MMQDLRWPMLPMTEKQEKKFFAAFEIAIEQAGSIGKLAGRLCAQCGADISHQALRNWLAERRIPTRWALVMEEYTEGEANFFDLCPWMLPRAVQYHQMIEQQQSQKKAS